MVKCLPEFEYFYCVLENKNIFFKIRRSKVTDYAALNDNWEKDLAHCPNCVFILKSLMSSQLCELFSHQAHSLVDSSLVPSSFAHTTTVHSFSRQP